MHLKEVNDATRHKIISGGEYQWNCYANARYLDYEYDSGSASVVYNTKTQEIYEAVIEPEDSTRPYRWLNPETKEAMNAETDARGLNDSIAYDDITWIDLETEHDFLEKLTAIVEGLPFDSRIEVPIELSDADFTHIAKMAHEKDITFNDMITEILKLEVEKYQKEKGTSCGNGCPGCKC